MYDGITNYQLTIMFLLFMIMCATLTTAFVVSSKFYAARYIPKSERENLALNAKVRKFVGELILNDQDTKDKLNGMIKKEKEQ